MGGSENTNKAPKMSFWKGLKLEYNKIIWPKKETVVKEAAVVVAAAVLGLIIAALDTAIVFGLHFVI